jgi:hypothetical protein
VVIAAALVVGGATTNCAGPLGDSSPPQFIPIENPAQLRTYIEMQARDLSELAADRPEERVEAALQLARPLTPGQVDDLVVVSDFEMKLFEWTIPGTGLTGGDYGSRLQARALEYPGLRVVYVGGIGRVSDLAALTIEDGVWLVDLGTAGNLHTLAVDAGLADGGE